MRLVGCAASRVGFLLLAVITMMPSAFAATHSHSPTDFERMFWLFYVHNANSIPEQTIAASMAYHFPDGQRSASDCLRLQHSTTRPQQVELTRQLIEQFRDFRFNREGQIDDARFTFRIFLHNAYTSYDVGNRHLRIRPFDPGMLQASIESPSRQCTELLDLPLALPAEGPIFLPTQFVLDFAPLFRRLNRQITQGYRDNNDAFNTAGWLAQLPLSRQVAETLTNRPSIDKTLVIEIDYIFQPRRPFQETDIFGRKNRVIRQAANRIVYTMPTHDLSIESITYRDAKTGRTLARKGVKGQGMEFWGLLRNANAESIDLLHTDSAINDSQASGLPPNLIFRDDAIVVRSDDSIEGKTPAATRVALLHLSQRLAIAADAPALRSPDSGVLVGDLLGERADLYFERQDLSKVQSLNYNKHLKDDKEGFQLVTAWRRGDDTTELGQRFMDVELTELRRHQLRFPIRILELRRVLVRPYDAENGGFPLLPINITPTLTLTDIRSPTIEFEALLPEPLPTFWTLDYDAAEVFNRDYYKNRSDNAAYRWNADIKMITLASEYHLISVYPYNGKTGAVVKIKNRTLHLDDDATMPLMTVSSALAP